MSCKIENKKFKGVESLLGEELVNIYKSLDKAKEEYDKISSREFITEFGDWINEDIPLRTNVNGEPLLNTRIGKNGTKTYFFKSKDENIIDLEVKEFSTFESDNLTSDVKEITEQLSSHIYNKYIKNNFEDITSIRKINVKLEIENYAKNKLDYFNNDLLPDAQDSEDIAIIEEAIDKIKAIITHSDEFSTEVITYFDDRKLSINDSTVQDNTQISQQEGLQGGDISQSFERNSKDKASANVKLLLSFLPKYEFNEESNSFEPVIGSVFGESIFVPFDVVHKELMNSLGNITTYTNTNGSISDIYNTMIGIISELSIKKPYYRDLLKVLDGYTENKKNEFVSAFFNTKINFYSSTVEPGVVSQYKTFNSSIQKSEADRLLNNWYKNFTSLYLEEGKFNTDKLQVVLKNLNNTIVSLNKERKGFDPNTITEEQFTEKFEDIIRSLEEILLDLGVDSLTPEAYSLFLNRLEDTSTNKYLEVFNKLQGVLSHLSDAVKVAAESPKKKYYNPFKEYKSSIFKSLSESISFYSENPAEDTIRSGNKMYWTFGNPSYTSNVINKIKANDNTLDTLEADIYNGNSQWISHLKAKDKNRKGDYKFNEKVRASVSSKRINSLELGTFNSFQLEGDSSTAQDNMAISSTDQIVDEMNKVLRGGLRDAQGKRLNINSIYSTSQAADKSTRYEIKIDYFINDTISSIKKGGISFSNEVLNIFTGYFEDEINRMRQAYQELEAEKDLKVHYHVDKDGNSRDNKGILIGNAFKSQLFPEFSSEAFVKSETNNKIQLFNSDGSPKFENERGLDSLQKEVIKELINKILVKRIEENFISLKKKRIIQKARDPKTGEYTNQYIINGLDSRVINEYKDMTESYATGFAPIHITSDYTINSMIANVEYTKMFTGDPAFYKNMVDFFKRVPATYTDGINLRLKENDSRFFKAVVLENQIVKSEYLDQISKSLDQTKMTEDEKAYVLSMYKEVNQTDAQGWITPKRWKFLMDRLGKWNNQYESVYNKMESGEALDAKEMKYVAQPVKGVYFGIVNGKPTYLKYSQAVLTPQLVKDNPLEEVYNKMINSDIDEAITLDGVKVGANIPTAFNGSFNNYMLLNNSDWKLQQDLPTKLVKSTLLGSQIQKNIYGSIDINDDNIYTTIDGKMFSSSEIIESTNDVISSISNFRIDELSLDLGKDSSGRIDESRFYSILEQELLEKKYGNNGVGAIQKNLPIDLLPDVKDKMYSMLFSKIRKAAVKIQTNGGSFIQVSNYGLDRNKADEMGVKWLISEEEIDGLKPPTIVEDLDGNKTVRPGQIFINHAQIVKYIPNYQNMSLKELNEKIDKRLLRAIGYRIPNQGMSSNDALQIVGILPPNQGDAIVAYTEIPTKTGSDFDIDKMYVMLPSMKATYNNRSYKKAYKYVSDNLNREDLIDELYYFGYSKEFLNDENVNIEKIFVEEVLMDSESTSEYQSDFLNEIKEGDVDKVSYIEYPDSDNLSLKQMENKLFELYWAILTNPKTYGDLITPIDFPHVKDSINKLHGDTSRQTGKNLKFYDPLYQAELKKIYINGKAGVGMTANQLVDHVRSRHLGLSFNNYYLGIGHINEDGETLFDQEYSQELNGTKYKISHTISAFLNAFVDNAKDPYISIGNYNLITSGTAFMLIRAGVHPDWINAFIGQPILREYTEFTDSYESLSIPKENEYESSFDKIYQKYLDIYNSLGGTKEDLPDVNSEYFTLPNFTELKHNIDNQTELTLELVEDQLIVMDIFKKFQDKAKKLNESVNLSRFDTEGAGKGYLDMITYTNRIKEILAKENSLGEIKGHLKKYITDNKLTSLGTQVINSLEYSKEILDNNPNLFLLSSENILDLYNRISASLPNPWGNSRGLLKDVELGVLLSKELYSYTMSDFNKFKINENPLDYIKDTANKIVEYKEDEIELSEEEKNYFINNLEFINDSFGIFSKNMGKQHKDQLYRAFKDLMEEDSELADRIAIAAFFQNGFNRSLLDIREYIPNEWFIRNGIRGFFKFKSDKILDNKNYNNTFFKQIVMNNSENNILVPNVTDALRSGIEGIDKREAFKINTKTEENRHDRYVIGTDTLGNKVFTEFVKYKEMLYELDGYINGNPIYKRINKLGYTDKKSHLNIKEYGKNNITTSSFPENNSKYATSVKESLKKLNRQPRYIFKEKMVPTEFIQSIYTKNLSDILKSDENFVSSQEDLMDIDPFNNKPKKEDENNC